MTTGKEIHIYDNLLPLQLRDSIFGFIKNSMFRIGWQDGSHDEAVKHKYLYSTYSDLDTQSCGLLPYLHKTAIAELIKDLKLEKSIVNLSVPTDTHFAHAHPEKLVVLYYANMKWEQHWHGETLFYTESLEDIELAIRYKPGRIVVFDASIPHSIRPQSIAADHYRFTYAMTFN